MIKKTTLILTIFMCVLTASANDTVDLEGHLPGRPTMDLEAATKYAIAKELPLLLNFTGSDWCGWCKIMEKNVFNQQAWSTYAKDNVVMVWLDFPKDKKLVPEKYVARNNELRKKYSVRGYPSYLIIEAKAGTVIGKLGAGRDKTPASFRAEVEELTSMTEKSVNTFAAKLGKEKAAEYSKMFAEIKQRQESLEKAKEQYNILVMESNSRINSLKEAMQESRVTNGLSAKDAATYLTLRNDLKDAKKSLQSFLSTAPEKTLESMAKFQELGAKVKELQTKLAGY
jgi:thioredoxin-related protein